MNDEWLEKTYDKGVALIRRRTKDDAVFFPVDAIELIPRLMELRRLRELESLALREFVESCTYCKCPGIRMVMQNGRCWHCDGKVTS